MLLGSSNAARSASCSLIETKFQNERGEPLASTATRKATASGGSPGKRSKVKKRRRTKGPSEKIRSLAALSLANKVGYLTLATLVGDNYRDAEAFDRLAKRNYKEGETVYPGRHKGPVLLMVKSGSVTISRPTASGSEFEVKTVGQGSIFGDMPLLGQSMLGAYAVAAEPSKIITITTSDFEKIAGKSSSIALNVIRQLGPRLVETERKHEQAAFQPVTSRVASLLTKLSKNRKDVVGHTHQEMADMLGVYRETVTNAIAELKADKLVKVGRKRITLLNPEAIRKMETI